MACLNFPPREFQTDIFLVSLLFTVLKMLTDWSPLLRSSQFFVAMWSGHVTSKTMTRILEKKSLLVVH